MTKIGEVKTATPLPTVGPATIDERQAAAEAIAAYLLSLVFKRWNGSDSEKPTTDFQLRQVTREWPEPGVALNYPCASIIDLGMGDYQGANFTPVILEDTIDRFGTDTVLWKLDELVADFQIDFWSNDAPTREAIAARLPNAFAPGEEGCVILSCSDRYYGETVRATLRSKIREDDSSSAYTRERRLRTTVRIEIGVLDLRVSRRADFRATVSESEPVASDSGEC